VATSLYSAVWITPSFWEIIVSTHLAYLAGFFDGEGTQNHWTSGGYTYYRLFLSNTNREILQLYQDEFGGAICNKKLHSPLSRKPMWTWSINGEGAWDAYYKMRPYLREKIWKGEPKG